MSCYPEKEEQYITEYNNLNRVSLALKFMMEYVAAKTPKGEVTLGIGKYEYILAICSLIIEWAYKNDLCREFVDEREAEFKQILMFWKVQGFYDRERINKLIDEFEQFYDNLLKQE